MLKRYLNSLTDHDLDIIRNSIQSSLGDGFKVLNRQALIIAILNYCKTYRLNAYDLKSRFFTPSHGL